MPRAIRGRARSGEGFLSGLESGWPPLASATRLIQTGSMARKRPRPRHRSGNRVARAVPALVGVALVAVFGGYAVVGPNGLLAWSDYRSRHVVAERQLAGLQAERAALANRVRLLDPRGANPDLADELVRRELGVIRPDEVVLPVK